jgi:D-mannonate dehydratase
MTDTVNNFEEIVERIKTGDCKFYTHNFRPGRDLVHELDILAVTNSGKVLAFKSSDTFFPSEIRYNAEVEKIVVVTPDVSEQPMFLVDTKSKGVDRSVKDYNDFVNRVNVNRPEYHIQSIYWVADIIANAVSITNHTLGACLNMVTNVADDQARINEIINQCRDNVIKKCIGKILQLPEADIEAVIKEIDYKVNMPMGIFGLSLPTDPMIFACLIIKRMRDDWNYSAIFNDRSAVFNG